ncbi:hypothetical protein AY633_03965 [Planococcus maritimus]|nr:hypothetical protein AY633_03965 [Planococcus maritimus]
MILPWPFLDIQELMHGLVLEVLKKVGCFWSNPKCGIITAAQKISLFLTEISGEMTKLSDKMVDLMSLFDLSWLMTIFA